jgi:prepilin-type processing-associated H-X9-DG protein
MHRPNSATVLILFLSLTLVACVYAADNAQAPAGSSGSVSTFQWGGPLGAGAAPVPPWNVQLRANGFVMADTSLLKWPDKKISLNVKDTSIQRLAWMLGAQTGIRFTVKPGVRPDLKITLQVSEMDAKQFLDMLCGATNLTYVAENRASSEEAKSPPDGRQHSTVTATAPAMSSSHTSRSYEITTQGGTRIETKSSWDAKQQSGEQHSKVEVTAPTLRLNPTGQGFEILTQGGAQIVMLNGGTSSPVTDVTISSLAAEGVVVNMGMVSMSVKDADPVAVATKLIDRIKGSSYMIMELKDYIALQDPDRAAEIEKAVKQVPRQKVTMSLRNRPITIALMQLAQEGHFYITIPQGINGYLIVPDVQVVNASVLPPLAGTPFAPFIGQDQAQQNCLNYMRKMATEILLFAGHNDGRLPDASKWIEQIPVMDSSMTGAGYQYAYAMNTNLSGKKLSDIADPAKTVLLFECTTSVIKGTERDVVQLPRHPGGINFVFLDGHAVTRRDVPKFGP